ncbi:glycoside hydrolase family 3 protein [soil metagenome]
MAPGGRDILAAPRGRDRCSFILSVPLQLSPPVEEHHLSRYNPPVHRLGPVWSASLLITVVALILAGPAATASSRSYPPPPSSGQAEVALQAPDLSPEALQWVEATLGGLTLRQRVAQLVMPWVQGGRLAPGSAEHRRLRRWLEEDQVGGLIVGRGAADEFGSALNAAQALSRVPLLVVSDLETGPGMRLTGGTNFPPAMAFGAAGDEALAREAGRVTGREARAVGIHMTLGPVLDVNHNPLNPIINTRSFGERPALVARLGRAWAAGAREEGLATVGKHFPGHGATALDSHVGLPVISAGPEQLFSVDLMPFQEAILGGIEGILVGHIAVAAFDGPDAPPASLSHNVITTLLREQMGFQGLVFTDALNMGAITRRYSVEEASVLALLAGADVLLQPPGERSVIDAIVAAVEQGRIPASRIEESARRVLTAKAAAGLHREPSVSSSSAARQLIGGAAHADVVRRLSEGSITLVRDRTRQVPLAPDARSILHLVYGRAGSQFSAPALTAMLQADGRMVQTVRVDERTTAAAFASLRERARASDMVLVSANVFPREYVGIHLQDGFSSFVEELALSGLPVIAISFGTPYLLASFPSVPTYLLAWSGISESQRALGRALLGRAEFHGRLPVTLAPEHGVQSEILPAASP